MQKLKVNLLAWRNLRLKTVQDESASDSSVFEYRTTE